MENETKPDRTALDFDATFCELPIHHLPAILNFMSATDFALGESSENLPIESSFGRGAILGFLAQSAAQLVEHVEKVEQAVDGLNQTINANESKGELHVELHGYYQRLVELSTDAKPTQLVELKMMISRLEHQLSLSASDALVDFKVENVGEK